MTGKDKNEARRLLEKRDFDGLFLWMQSVRSPLRIVFSLTFDTDELIVWRAIEATGKIAAATAASDVEKVRDFIRRLLWLMNDESGALGWHAPEVIGEILVNVPSLIEEIGVLLPRLFQGRTVRARRPLCRISYHALQSCSFSEKDSGDRAVARIF